MAAGFSFVSTIMYFFLLFGWDSLDVAGWGRGARAVEVSVEREEKPARGKQVRCVQNSLL